MRVALKNVVSRTLRDKVISSVVLRYIESASQQKLEFLKSKYKLETTQLNQIVAVDPTDNGEYLDWVASQVKKNNLRLPEDTQILRPALELLHTIKRKRVFKDNKDINSYKSPGDLYSTLESYKDKSEESSDMTKRLEQAGEGHRAVVNVQGGAWYEVTTPEAACALGSGTSWCTVPDAETTERYLEEGPLYILIKNGKPNAQVHFESGQFRDAADRGMFNSIGSSSYVLPVFKQDLEDLYKALRRKSPFQTGPTEEILGTAHYIVKYAALILKERWPEVEPLILQKAAVNDLIYYVSNCIKGRWPEAEPRIISSSWGAIQYAKRVVKGKFPEGESAIAKDARNSYEYAREILHDRFPAGEAEIVTNAETAYFYAMYIIKGRWLEAEPTIATSPKWATYYAKKVIKGRWPLAEESLAHKSYFREYYTKALKEIGIEVPFLRSSSLRSIVAKYITAASQQKIDFLTNRYKLNDNVMNVILDTDPTPNGEYLEWVIGRWLADKLRLPEDSDTLKPALEAFHKLKTRRVFKDSKDIRSYDSPGDLYETLDKYKSKAEESSDVTKRLEQAGAGYKEVVRGAGFVWYEVTTPEAACALGSGTSWCTVPNKVVAGQYLEEGPFYILYMSGKPTAQVHFESLQFMDRYDNSLYENIGPFRLMREEFLPALEALFSKVHRALPVHHKIEAVLPRIASRADYAYEYARDILKGRFPEGERIISESPTYAYHYARDVIGGPWPEGELALLKRPDLAYNYARSALGRRWPEAESIIARVPDAAFNYARDVVKGRWPEAEPTLVKDPGYAYYYALHVIKGRWPEAEPLIAKDAEGAYIYAKDVIEGRWPEAEPVIAKNAETAYKYARFILKTRWPEAEPFIQNSRFGYAYADTFKIKDFLK